MIPPPASAPVVSGEACGPAPFRGSGLIRAALLLLLLALSARLLWAAAVTVAFPYDLLMSSDGLFTAAGIRMRERATVYADPRGAETFIAPVHFPGFCAVVGAATALLPDPVRTPRGVALLLWLPMAAAVYVSVRRLGGGAMSAGMAAAFCIVVHSPGGYPLPLTYGTGAHYAFLYACIWALHVARSGGGLRWAVLAALFGFGATWFRQSALLLVAFLPWVLRPLGRRTAIGTTALYVALVAAPVLLLQWDSGGWFTFHTVENLRGMPFHTGNWIRTLRYLAFDQPILVATLLWGAWRAYGRGDENLRPWVDFAILAGSAAAVTSGKWGSGPTHVQVAVGAVAVLAGVLAERARRSRPAAAGLAALLIGATLPSWSPFLLPGPDDEADGARLTALVRSVDGPILTDRHLGLVLASGRRPDADLSRAFEVYRVFGWEPEAVIDRVRDRRYAMILSSLMYEPPALRAAIDERYVEIDRIEHIPGGPFWRDFHVLVPRGERAP